MKTIHLLLFFNFFMVWLANAQHKGLVANEVYPAPYFGLNNLIIPDTLCRQNWCYHQTFDPPVEELGKKWEFLFKGINYKAEIWLNGHYLESLKGAFIRG